MSRCSSFVSNVVLILACNPLSLSVELSSLLDPCCGSSSFLSSSLPVELSSSLDSSPLDLFCYSFFLVAVTIKAIIPLSLPGEFSGGRACFLGLVVLSLTGVSFFRLGLGPGEDIVARVLI